MFNKNQLTRLNQELDLNRINTREKGNINLYQAWLESFWSDFLPDITKIIISLKNIRIYLDKSGYFDKIHVSAIKYRYLTVDAQYTTGGRLGFRLCLV